jgi:hypothetical protein
MRNEDFIPIKMQYLRAKRVGALSPGYLVSVDAYMNLQVSGAWFYQVPRFF